MYLKGSLITIYGGVLNSCWLGADSEPGPRAAWEQDTQASALCSCPTSGVQEQTEVGTLKPKHLLSWEESSH